MRINGLGINAMETYTCVASSDTSDQLISTLDPSGPLSTTLSSVAVTQAA